MYLTVRQVAERLAVSQALVYQLVESGELKCYRLGARGSRGTIRITESQLATFLEDREKGQERSATTPAATAPRFKPPVLRNLRLKPS
jgi:excisionase family DNA binding protein